MEHRVLWRKILSAAGITAALWALLWIFGPVLLPFAVGLTVARAADPALSALCRQLRLPRWLAAGVCVSAVYILLALAVSVLCRILCRELMGFARSLPALAQSLAAPMARLEQRLLQIAGRFPDGIGHALEEGVAEFFRNGAGLGSKLYNRLFDFASAVLQKTPDLALFLLTAVLSSFMIASQLPGIRALWETNVPQRWQQRLQTLLHRIKSTLGVWLRTQMKLMGICFLVLTTGFLLLQVAYPLLFGFVIALIDALPALGSGLILIPWGLLSYLRGDTLLGTGLLILYGAAALLRTSLEPRFLGKQIGLPPLVTLLALYGGYRFLGIWGMILFPLGAMLIRQFADSGKKN